MKAEGLSSKEIGERLGISERTVQRSAGGPAAAGPGRRRVGGDLSGCRHRQQVRPGTRRSRPPPRMWSAGSRPTGWPPERMPGPIRSATPSADDSPGTRLALLRAEMNLRWEAGDSVTAHSYLDRYPGLDEETTVALVYEEFCLAEEAGRSVEPDEFLGRFPEVAARLRRVLAIHDLVGSSKTASMPTGSRHHRGLSRGRPDDRRLPPRRGAGPGRLRARVSRRGAATGGSAGGVEGRAGRLARAADPGPAPAHAYRPGPLVAHRSGDGPAPALHALSRLRDTLAAAGR